MLEWLTAGLGAAGKIMDYIGGQKNAKAQMAQQERYAKHGIQWKVADAKAAGIHPIYALGAQTHSYAPVSVGGGLGEIGQDIGRAISATSSQSGKVNTIAQSLAIENASLQNDLLRSQIARLRTSPTPALPTPATNYVMPGQHEAGEIAVKEKVERKNFDPAHPSGEAFGIPDVGFSHTGTGSFFPMPSDEAKQRIEDNPYQEFMHYLRNNVMPALSVRYQNPPNVKLPDGQEWVYDPVNGYMVYDWKNGRYLAKSHR